MTARTHAPRSLRPLAFGLVCLALLTGAGCFKHPQVAATGVSCRSDDNCLVGYTCVAGICQRPGQDAASAAETSVDLPRNEDAPTSPDSQAGAEAAVPDVTLAGQDGPISATGGTPATGGISATGGATETGGSTASGGVPTATGGTYGNAGGSVSTTGGTSSTGGIAIATGGMMAGTGGQSTGGNTTATAAECEQPADPDHGSVSMPSLVVSSVATYACNVGYQLQGLSQRTCQASLIWSGTAPICVPVDCGALAAPTNGTVDAPITTYLSTASYACTGSATLTGNPTRSCLAAGTWSGAAPVCECAQTMCKGTCVDLQSDSQNCGACGTLCSAPTPSRAACALARCVVTLADTNYPSGITVVGSTVFWLDASGQKVMKIPTSGGNPTTLATGQNGLTEIAADATNVYWTVTNDSRVMKVAAAGGTPVILASNENSFGIAVDATYAYWTTYQGDVKRIPIGGGIPETIGSGTNFVLAVDSTSAYWGTPDGIAKAPLAGGTASLLVTDPNRWHFAVDATNIYWIDKSAGTVMKMPLGGGAAVTIASGQDSLADVAVDSANVYWTCGNNPYKVMKAPIQGGSPVTLANGTGVALRIAVDATSVYWGDLTSMAVLKVTPK
jgi:hypothetical protein